MPCLTSFEEAKSDETHKDENFQIFYQLQILITMANIARISSLGHQVIKFSLLF